MRKFFLGLLMSLAVPNLANADGKNLAKSEGVIRVVDLPFSSAVGFASIVVREHKDPSDQPYAIEVRSLCSRESKSWRKLPVLDKKSACYVDAQSIEYDVKSETIQLRIQEVDSEFLKENLRKDPPEFSYRCLPWTKQVFELKDLCLVKVK